MKTSEIEVRDMLSVWSVAGVENRIGEVPGVESVTVNYAAGTATVRYDETRLNVADIKSAVRQGGYEPTEPAAASGGDGHEGHGAPGTLPATPAPVAPKSPPGAPTAPGAPKPSPAAAPTSAAPKTAPVAGAAQPASADPAGGAEHDKAAADKS